MRRLIVCFTVLCGVILLLPPAVVGQKQPDKKKTKVKLEETTPQDYAALNQAAEITGRITFIDTGTRLMTLRVEFQTMEANPKAKKGNPNKQTQELLRLQQQWMKEYENIMRIRNPFQREQRLMQLQERMARDMARLGGKMNPQNDLFRVVTVAKEFDLDLLDDVRVARSSLPTEYDDKGDIKKYSTEELKKLKDKVLPGYTAKLEEVMPGQAVKLYLLKKKGDSKVKTDEVQPGATLVRPQVRMILITQEADLPLFPKDLKKKKK